MPSQAPSPRYIAALLIVATLILVVGSLLKPEPTVATEAAPAPPQSEVRRLYRMSLRASVDRVTEYFALVAGDIDPLIVRMAQLNVSAIVWDPRTVVGAAAGTRTPETTLVVTPGGETLAAFAVAAGPDLPLVGMQIIGDSDLTAVPRGDSEELQAGQWVLAAWRDQVQARHTPGNLVGSMPTTCGGYAVDRVETSIGLSRMMLGGGLFDIEGRLVAIVLECDDRPVAVSTGSVAGLLAGATSTSGRLWHQLGLKVAVPTPAQAEHFEVDSGVLVSEVWRGYAADRAGFRPGDILVELGEQPVQSGDDLAPLLQPSSEPLRLAVKRGPRTLTLSIRLPSAAGTTESARADAIGLTLEPDTAGFPIEAVQPGSREDAAGIRPGDRVLRVDFAAPTDLRQLRRLLANHRDRALFIELRRGPRAFGLLVE